MKKLITLMLLALLISASATANDDYEYPSRVLQTSYQDTLVFALPYQLDHFMNIQNYVTTRPKTLVMRFQPEYLITANDFTHGDANKGTDSLPALAKVIRLSLDGYDYGTVEKDPFIEVVVWCRNTTETELPGTDADQGYYTNRPQGQLLIDTIANRNFHQNTPGYLYYFDESGDSVHPAIIVDAPFDKVFTYDGKNIVLTLWISTYESEHMKYRYMTYESADTRLGSLFRSGNWCFNYDTKNFGTAYGITDIIETMKEYAVPAFNLHYYTNDIFVNVTGDYENIVLKCNGTEIPATAADEGYANFENLDHTATYELYIDGTLVETLTFEDITKDIIVMVSVTSEVKDVEAEKQVTGVRYFSVTGAEMREPADGINIVVTTYSDGTRTTTKVLR